MTDPESILDKMKSIFGDDIASPGHNPLQFHYQAKLAKFALDEEAKRCQATSQSASEESKTESAPSESGKGESETSTDSTQTTSSDSPESPPTTESDVAVTCAATQEETSSTSQTAS
jgi:hypothetical protein